MHSDLIGVVARFETTKRLAFGEVDLKLLVLSQVKLWTTWLSRQPAIFSSVYQCYIPFFPSMFPSFQPLAIITKCPILDVTEVLDPPLSISNMDMNEKETHYIPTSNCNKKSNELVENCVQNTLDIRLNDYKRNEVRWQFPECLVSNQWL